MSRFNIDVLTLKNGEVYRGEIVLRTDDIVMLKTADGKRYQFQIRDIEKFSKSEMNAEEKSGVNQLNQGNFAGILDINGGLAYAPAADIRHAGAMGFSLAFGSRSALGTSAFLGVGAGYETVFGNDKKSDLSFMPVYIQTYIPLNEKKIAPSFGSKISYKFALNDLYKGGLFFHVSDGINYRLTARSSLFFGLQAQTQRISGTVIEINELGEFYKQGNALLSGIGLNVAFMF